MATVMDCRFFCFVLYERASGSWSAMFHSEREMHWSSNDSRFAFAWLSADAAVHCTYTGIQYWKEYLSRI